MKDKTAFYFLFQSIDESGFEKIASATIAKEAWDFLEKVYKGADRVKRVTLKTLHCELEAIKMKETEGIYDYITRVQTVVNKLKRNGESLTDSRAVEKILWSLTDKFENVVCAIDDLSSSLEEHEQRKLKNKQESFDVALQTNVIVDDGKEEKAMYVEQGRGRGFDHVDDTVMMTNEEVVLEINTTWYLDTAATNQNLNDEDEPKSLQNLYDSANKMHFVCHKADSESVSLEKAVRDKKWKVAMDEEITSIEMNETCDLVELPKGHQPIGVKWVFSKKMNTQGEVERHKARLIATGYQQQPEIDCDEIFASVARMESIRLLISQAAQFKWSIYHTDVKSTLLNGVLKEEVYVKQPPEFKKAGNETQVLKLRNALYGLKQAPWNTQIDLYLKKNGYAQCPYEHALYVKNDDSKMLLVFLSVDDILFVGNDEMMIKTSKKK
nr:retrovirus-related Pol polyprotein from transposon TNT 1-94 [Tanacetum cinerariifolium]